MPQSCFDLKFCTDAFPCFNLMHQLQRISLEEHRVVSVLSPTPLNSEHGKDVYDFSYMIWYLLVKCL